MITAVTSALLVCVPASATPYAGNTIVTWYPNDHRCLDAAAEHIHDNGTPVQLWTCYDDSYRNQRWSIRHQGYDGVGELYQIVNLESSRCLDATAEWGGVNGTPIQLWDCYGPGQTNQLWYIRWHDPGFTIYTIESVAFHRLLDAKAEQLCCPHTPIQLWDDYGPGQTNQRWNILAPGQR
ncbi:RICIN domain-containing protein [Amycolatopsis sp. NPDC051128]|uniref:RICIN domain-containing protein n=1 Tax=Amycolatopsis sp. NPDC051128 TaxID=3155412 RepID=UPI00343677FF